MKKGAGFARTFFSIETFGRQFLRLLTSKSLVVRFDHVVLMRFFIQPMTAQQIWQIL
jgi:hypothetical protein